MSCQHSVVKCCRRKSCVSLGSNLILRETEMFILELFLLTMLMVPFVLIYMVIDAIPAIIEAILILALSVGLAAIISTAVHRLLHRLLHKRVPSVLSVLMALALSVVICLWITGDLPERPEKPESISSVTNSMIGRTYYGFTDGKDSRVLFPGYIYDRCCLTIIDNKTLKYTVGRYRFGLVEKQPNEWIETWAEDSISDDGISGYKITYNYITGKTILEFDINGKETKCQIRLKGGDVMSLIF